MSLFETQKMKHAMLQRISFLQSMPQLATQFVLVHSIAPASEFVAKQNYEKPSERKRRDARRHEPRPVRPGSDRQGGGRPRKSESKGPRRGGMGGGGF